MIDIVIVNWNAGKLIQSCIESIHRYDDAVVNNIFVVDNGSTDGSDSKIGNRPLVTLIRAKENLGFAKACNLGAGYATSEFVLFLNPDTLIFPDTFKRVLGYMSEPEQVSCGICGIQLLDDKDNTLRHCSRIPTISSLLFHTLGFDRLIPKLGYVMGEWDHMDTRRVDHVIGAFYLVRRSVFVQLCGFDERFFVYLEDLDFSLRAKQNGWDCAYYSEAKSHHLCGGTSRQVKAKRLFYSVRSRILYVYKHFSQFDSAKILITTMIIEPLTRIMWSARIRSLSSLTESLTAYGYLLQWIYKKAKHKLKLKLKRKSL